MTRKIICAIAIVVIGICLVSGGCDSAADNRHIKAWKDLITLVPEKKQPADAKSSEKVTAQAPASSPVPAETTKIKLYFAQAGQEDLVVEERTIAKTEGIARKTVEELIKGPENAELTGVFPPGSKLLDINIKEDGTCVIDLNSQVKDVGEEQERMMIHAVASTLGQFPTVQEVSFLINGQKISDMMGGVDLSIPVKAGEI